MLSKKATYRLDIDGLRAIAVSAVILFHLGFMPNGYLGVDVFFVISGYLITKIIFKESKENRFSIKEFYLRRIRRIIPLVLFSTITALIVGIIVMLPDDLENLAQSVFATNFFSNNILLLITTGDYWDLVNDYKPLMHTWSLGVEEQFYLFYPLIFILFKGNLKKYILPFLVLSTILSFFFYLTSNEANRFYLVHTRFFELSLGGIGAITMPNGKMFDKIKFFCLILLIVILSADLSVLPSIKIVLVCFSSLGILVFTDNRSQHLKFVLTNKLIVWIGKISFSLYMWHQIVLSYARYFVLVKMNYLDVFYITLLILILSTFSYYYIEQIFRNKDLIRNRTVIYICTVLFTFSTILSLYIYAKGGILRDVPELDIYKKETNIFNLSLNIKENPHIKYNSRIYSLDKKFTSKKIKILIIGNSFARDWANVLIESVYNKFIEISYTEKMEFTPYFKDKANNANYIFFSELDFDDYLILKNKYKLNSSIIWNIGTKNFGSNNGFFYNNKLNNKDYCFQRVLMEDEYYHKNNLLKKQWGPRYIDLVSMIMDAKGTLPVFTSNCKFISQDCRHLTQNGAKFFAEIISKDENFILKKVILSK
ncbi:acyltransferase [Lacihabitans sp. CS3-21]|uniref:acyltransferase family protein n=1 Tax=Lacihabitans sp. CS3-21 TaxID=2487332 RepID=UPI0020CF9D44|nr:acyltransferase [Lacihabitans sp. CS3-21]MCP9747557.1 acyltransferase [Lacihabitans sp. CS3-21]